MSDPENSIEDVLEEKLDQEKEDLRQTVARLKTENKALVGVIQKQRRSWGATQARVEPVRKVKVTGDFYRRVALGDLHGTHLNRPAFDAFLNDLEVLDPEEIVLGGDLMECASSMKRHPRSHLYEFAYSFADDVATTNWCLDAIQKRARRAKIYYLGGNHEFHVERTAAERFDDETMAQVVAEALGPKTMLHLDKRGIEYFHPHDRHLGLEHPGVIKLGECYFEHGFCGGEYPTARTVKRLGGNVVHFHNHRAQSHIIRLVDRTVGGWCPGCLCDIQRYYFHATPTDHTNGYHLQFVNRKTGWFSPWNISVMEGVSLLPAIRDALIK